ncbi:MAG: 50S ribosomal protein L3 [Dehalococcoidia bacterium]|nr:50S ribosomal protein L3 [Dehalococcoidia bacterium]
MGIGGLIGKKIGMTQLFTEQGGLVGVTAIQAGPCTVSQIRLQERDGYTAVQLGFEELRPVTLREGMPIKRAVKRKDVKPLTLPEVGHLRRAGHLFRHLREVPATGLGDVQVGQRVDVSLFKPGEHVHVTGTSKGHGFSGVVKRHGFKGGPKTHGQSDRHRAPGSIGSTTYAGRVFKGMRMAGHWGDERITVRNLEVVKVDPERNLLFLKGAVPGGSRGILIIRKDIVREAAK